MCNFPVEDNAEHPLQWTCKCVPYVLKTTHLLLLLTVIDLTIIDTADIPVN